MIEIIGKGILSGIVLAFLIGPVFFAIIQTSMERGFRSGVLMAIGVSLSDACFISLTYLGFATFFENASFRSHFALIGGLILLLFGAYYLFVKGKRSMGKMENKVQLKKPLKYVVKGFVLNGLSPLVFAFWIGTMSFAATELGYTSDYEIGIYFGSIVVTVFITDVLKARLSDRLRRLVTPRFVKIMNIVLGAVFLGAGMRLIFFTEETLRTLR